jgi:hypothetical protein
MSRSPLRILVALALATLCVTSVARAQTNLDAVAPADTLSPAHPTVTVPLTLTRTDTTHVGAVSVTFTLSGGLSLANGTASITLGGFLGASGGTPHLEVLDLGGGSYRADGVTLGDPCGSAATSGTLFAVELTGTGSGTGALTLDSARVRDCDNLGLPFTLGGAASVTLDHGAPTLALTSPVGGESWAAHSTHAITWTASDPAGIAIDGIDLAYSTDGGSSWTAIASGLASTGTYDWTVPDVATTTARVRVIARDAFGNVARDSSALAFTLVGTTVTAVSASVNPSAHGQAVSFTATVTPSAAGGDVQFRIDGVDFGAPVALSGGTATSGSIASLTVGTHEVVALYAGDVSHGASADTLDGGQVVSAAATTTALTSAPEPSVLADSVTLVATVTVTAPGVGTPADSVDFFDGAAPLGRVALDGGGVATLVTTALGAGPRLLHAVYLGDGAHAGSTSPDRAHEVKVRVIATAGAHGTVSPVDTTIYAAGATPAYTFTADSAYHVASVLVDGAPVALTSPYTFAPLGANHTLAVTFDVNPPVTALAGLASAPVKTGNDGSGRTRIRLTWTAPPAGSTVAVYRAPFGNYPEYDDGPSPGAVPSAPAYPPSAPWTLTSVATSGDTDLPPARDCYYYCAFVTDEYGTRSPVSTLTGGTLSYALGDVSDGITPGQGDGQVGTPDLSLLGSVYGRLLTYGDTFAYLDVGPTLDYSLDARPSTDDQLDFEDLVMLAYHFGRISGPQAAALPAAAATDALTLEVPASVSRGETFEAPLRASGTGALHALATRLVWDAAVVEPLGVTAGALLDDQGGVGMSARPGTFDAAIPGHGLTGEGTAAVFRFRALADGAPAVRLASVDARDATNRRVPVTFATAPGVAPVKPVATQLAAPTPMPFADRTTLAFGLAAAGDVDLAVFSIDGRRVRTLARGRFDAGEHRMEWDGRDDGGRAVPAGVYFARLQAPSYHATRRLLRVR